MRKDRPGFTDFRRRLKARERLFGTFLKTPTTHTTEILGALGLDFVIVDQEHAAFNRETADMISLAARAVGTAALVRVSDPSSILAALDGGATGVLVPHVDSVAKAKEIAAACRYRGGARGFANTTRAGGWGAAGFTEHMDEQDAGVTCVAMIEDLAALDVVDEIAKVEGVHAFFIGRGDLTAALGLDSQTAPQTLKAVERIAAAARAADLPTIVLPSNPEDAIAMRALGASAFVLSNEHSLLKQAAVEALKNYNARLG